ncbi:MAG: hypothetical protein HGA45_23360 [Chloroflexales bacterium]|nr:hypothetical protein [Chloroflexales bacterium]
MYQDTYYVAKRSGTLADPLLAYGTALLLQALLKSLPDGRYEFSCKVQIEDQGAAFAVHVPEPICEEWLSISRLPYDLARPVLRVAKPKEAKPGALSKPKPEKQALPECIIPIDYNAIWDGIRKANALIEEQRQTKRMTRDEISELRASHQSEYRNRDVALLIGDYRMQVEAIHNQAVTQWVQTLEAGYQAANLRAILQMFATPEADLGIIAKAWAKEVKLEGVKPRLTASQVFNPSMGKGQNQPKANQLAMGNEDVFWLLEYLKAVGLFTAAAPRAFTDEGMRKTYVLVPAKLDLNQHEAIFTRFKRSLDGSSAGPIKADVLTSLDYADAYLSYCRAARNDDPATDLDFNPRNTVQGFAVANYVLLSQNSFTMINLSSLDLPPWLNHTVRTSDDAASVQEVIEEHQAIIRPLNETFQEQNNLLDTYRDFLGGRTDALFAFCAGYGEHVVRTLPETQRIRQMSVSALDQIIRRIFTPLESPDPSQLRAAPLDPIIRRIDMPEVDPLDFVSTSEVHSGFHNIAYAIRQSTVIPQRQLANFKTGKRPDKPLYDVRYGLGNNLRRKTDSAADFIATLAEFLQLYNTETDQVYENTSEQRKNDPNYGRGRYRSRVAISDLDDVLKLIQKYGSNSDSVALVCNMLVAYGYAATKSRQEQAASNQSGDHDTNTQSNDESDADNTTDNEGE